MSDLQKKSMFRFGDILEYVTHKDCKGLLKLEYLLDRFTFSILDMYFYAIFFF